MVKIDLSFKESRHDTETLLEEHWRDLLSRLTPVELSFTGT
jgi:hypothetical protein